MLLSIFNRHIASLLLTLSVSMLGNSLIGPVSASASTIESPMMDVELGGMKLSIRVDGWMGAEFDEPNLPSSLLNYPTKNPRLNDSANQIVRLNAKNPRRYKVRTFWYSLGRGCKEHVIPATLCTPPAGFRLSELLIGVPGKPHIPIQMATTSGLDRTNPRISASKMDEGLRCEYPQIGLSCTFTFGVEGKLFGFLYLGTATGSQAKTSDLLKFTQTILNYLIRIEERSN